MYVPMEEARDCRIQSGLRKVGCRPRSSRRLSVTVSKIRQRCGRRKAIIGCSDQGSEYAEPGQLPSRLEIPVRREYGCIKRKTAVTAQTDWEPHRNYPDERYLVEHPNPVRHRRLRLSRQAQRETIVDARAEPVQKADPVIVMSYSDAKMITTPRLSAVIGSMVPVESSLFLL
jgi:hypothetical protein